MAMNGIGGNSVISVVQHFKKAQQAAAAPQVDGMYKQAQFLRELNSRLGAKTNVIVGQWYDPADDAAKDAAGLPRKEHEQFGSEGVNTIMVHPDFLRKMHDNPKLGEEYESKIRDYTASNEKNTAVDSLGMRVVSSGMYIGPDGTTERNGVSDAYVTAVSKYRKATPEESMEARAIIGTTKDPAAWERYHEWRENTLLIDGSDSSGGDASYIVDTTV